MIKNKLENLDISKIVTNKLLLILFNINFALFCFWVINQYSVALINQDFYSFFFMDGEWHINLIDKIDNELNFQKIHSAKLYFNNYYLFSLGILNILKLLPGYDYTLVGLSAVIINLLSIYIICISGYLFCFKLTKSKTFSLGLILLLWNADLIWFGLRIYPDILQLALIFLSFCFIFLNTKYKWFLSFVFCGLAFGTKAQGLLIFIYLISYYFISELLNKNNESFKFNISIKVFISSIFYSTIFIITFLILNQINIFQLLFDIYQGSKIFEYKAEFDNNAIAYKNLIYLLRSETNFIIFLMLNIINLFLIIFKKRTEKNILFIITFTFLILFYMNLINLNIPAQGPRYLYHFLPLILILLSISFNNIVNFIFKNKISFGKFVVYAILFIYGTNIFFSQNNLSFINTFNFKEVIKNNKQVQSYNYFNKNINSNKNDPLICASMNSPVPSNISKNIIKTWFYTDIQDKIYNFECDYIFLDIHVPGRYIWFEKKPNNLINKDFNTLTVIYQLPGQENIKKIQKLIRFLILNPNSGYEIFYYNHSTIILSKSKNK